MDNERYLYEVRPRKPVRIPGQRATMTRRSVLLTKEEVKEYMKNGPVYRKSAKGALIQVTGGTLEKLHAPFDEEKATVRPSSQTENHPQQHTASNQNNSHQWNESKKNKKHGGNNNYHGDDRGKAATNGSDANPQYSGNSIQEPQTSAAPVVNLP